MESASRLAGQMECKCIIVRRANPSSVKKAVKELTRQTTLAAAMTADL
jgi:hypothetical protein